MERYGKLIIFGSGETSESGKSIHRHILGGYKRKLNIAILETPAGFQPNSKAVASEIAEIFRTTLVEFVKNINIVPARKKGTKWSPDDISIISPIKSADYIFLGPGSPTYAVGQLDESLAMTHIRRRWKEGSAVCLSSAASMAMGTYTLPVYEIYKAGSELFWINGLDLLSEQELELTVITHWNNAEGGKGLDTRFCFMGEARFNKLHNMLPKNSKILGIDEQTAIILDFEKSSFRTDGAGKATLLKEGKSRKFTKGNDYPLTLLK